ncbi:DUF6248 family natural product biosynthesis protein [Nonomuraea sp. NPDC050328]|uniref:DUF6248 family natural product biosynthesis protein n=1 Tax=Nonomuraea sp. NPDC050328 TaxID=3364361 RepID=UPI00378A5058
MMTPAQAAWVREHAWTSHLRSEYRADPQLALCACQFGLSRHCAASQHGTCHHRAVHPSTEGVILDRRGHHARFPFDYQHAMPWRTPPGLVPPAPDAWASIWLANRMCRWTCPCDCHAPAAPPPPPSYELIPLFDLTTV